VIDWDQNATTPLHPDVAELLSRAWQKPLGNPSSVHRPGQAARARLEAARRQVAEVLGVEPREIAFVGSGSEANALAIKGAFDARKDRSRNRVVSLAIEHPSVLFALEQLERAGAEVVRVAPAEDGAVRVEDVACALEGAALCSVMWANNETGVLQPVRELARVCRERGVPFHSDAVQAAGKVPVSTREADVDLLSLSAHKFGGPAGVGVLLSRRGVELSALTPGHQEGARRGGTQALPLIEACALALTRATAEVEARAVRLAALRDRFEAEARARFGVRVNGTAARVANTSNLELPGADAEALLIALDLEGISVSMGAACASGSLKPSHVLLAMGRTPAQARSSLRFSLGSQATESEVDEVLAVLARHLPRIRPEPLTADVSPAR
jgi:cysteine desulfurase